MTAKPPSVEDVLAGVAGHDQLVHVEVLPERPSRLATASAAVPRDLLPPGGLWCHQAAAIDLAMAGQSVAVATGTASGKSLCYQLPIAACAGAGGTALLLYPTKALAHDQLRAMQQLPGVLAATYDGDTPPGRRAWVRRHASAVLTNPDMLHVGLLPRHEPWSGFLARLQYVVVDELHTLRGVFGTHVAHLLRRLRRLCARYGSAPTFVFCSATIGAPGALASSLCGLPVEEVTEDGSPRGERAFALWNPPLVDEAAGQRRSGITEAGMLLAAFVQSGFRTIAFTRSRKGAELVARAARGALPGALARTVRSYRGGYLAEERREIERELFGGALMGVSATNALELGIDVGGLDVCVLNGFPGTIASMWQQAGRAGRARQRAAAVLVAGEDQLDQWLMAHPREVFTRPPEPAVVNPSNPYVLDPHLGCAAYEQPLTAADEAYWGDDLDDGVRRLALADRVVVREGRAMWAGHGRTPAAAVGLRTGTSNQYQIVEAAVPPAARQGTPTRSGLGASQMGRTVPARRTHVNRLIGTVDESRAFSAVHPGALYLHQGQQYRVERLDLADRVAYVAPNDVAETTHPRSETSVQLLSTDSCVAVGRIELCLGGVEVAEQVVGYQRRKLFTREVVRSVALDLPPTRLVTRAFWYVVDDSVLAAAGVAAAVPGTVHAVEHAGIGILPLFTICDRWDVGGVSTDVHPQTGRATIVIYDGYPGGAGIAELGFGSGRRHLEATLDVIASCRCDAGCPSCVQSPKCGNWNEPLDKAGAVALLRTVLAEQ